MGSGCRGSRQGQRDLSPQRGLCHSLSQCLMSRILPFPHGPALSHR